MAAGLTGAGILAVIAGLVVLRMLLVESWDGSGYLLLADANYGITSGLLGMACLTLAAKARSLIRRTRAGLLVVGVSAVIVTLSHYVPLGMAMNGWLKGV
ncbi:hypothetical protein [Actinoplanes sp. NPDC051859]|uniref:hypothetical protein n=1 Tax=Actinoplanes sp. NPDC051859 TaxID=3363909 RepID=UPI0037A1B1B1